MILSNHANRLILHDDNKNKNDGIVYFTHQYHAYKNKTQHIENYDLSQS